MTGDTGNGQDQEPIWTAAALQDPHGQTDKAQRVRAMFNAIARRYDRANAVISFGQAGRWRRALVGMVRDRGVRPRRILDVCCGTGDMTELFADAFPGATILGVDFAEKMLRAARGKPACVAGDAMSLPVTDSAFDLVSCTFGVRNFQSLEAGLREMYRVLRPGGVLGVLEFQPPKGAVTGALFSLYFNRVLPVLGSWVTGSRGTGAYTYLPRSVQCWYDGKFLIELMTVIGWREIVVRPLCLGAVWAVTARK